MEQPHSNPGNGLVTRRVRAASLLPSATILILGLLCAVSALAQNGADVAAALPHQGFEIRNVSTYGAYYSSGLPPTGGPALSGSNLSSDAAFGASVELDWMRVTDHSTFFLTYSPSYTAQVGYSSLDALNHALAMSGSLHFAPHWTFGFSLAGGVGTLDESLFSPTALSTVAAVPATFQDLAGALLRSQFANNPQLGSALTTAPLIQSPLNALLYGERMFSASIGSSLSYSYSPRLKFTFGMGGARTQPLSNSQPLAAGNGSLALNATSGNATVGLSYSVLPRTEIGATMATNRTSSALYDTYITTTLFTVGQTLAHRWILQGHVGAGITNLVRQTGILTPAKPYPSAGGAVTLKAASHTFMTTYDRTVSNAYGLGPITSASANATWRWRLPGRQWWIDSTLGWQELQGGGLTNTSGWRSTTGFNQAVGPHVALRAEYAYLSYNGRLQDSAYKFSESAVRFSVSWLPPAYVLR